MDSVSLTPTPKSHTDAENYILLIYSPFTYTIYIHSMKLLYYNSKSGIFLIQQKIAPH